MQQMMGDILPIGVEPNQLPDPESNGAKLLSQYCSQCHKVPSPRLHTEQEWPFVLTRMVKRMDRMELGGMGMMQIESPSQADLEIISRYLEAHSMVGLDSQQLMEMTGPGVDAFREVCSACHALPNPRQYTRDTWPVVVDRMTQNMRALNRVVPSDSVLGQVIKFLQSNASVSE
jgi:cytochrome c5